MSEFFESEAVWLNITNAALGIVTLACLILVGRAVFQELVARARKAVHIPVEQDDHAFDIESLGITMADGGEPINENAIARSIEGVEPDTPNIIRSDN
ncbi:MAG: hypothetical protein WBD36_15195 [Bacteroidota bacterium]